MCPSSSSFCAAPISPHCYLSPFIQIEFSPIPSVLSIFSYSVGFVDFPTFQRSDWTGFIKASLQDIVGGQMRPVDDSAHS